MAVFGLELPLLLVLAGVALMILEALSPTEYFMILGVSLLLTGIVGTFVSPLATPIALAGLTFVFGAVAFYVYSQYDFYGGESAGQTSDSDSLRGASGHVVDRVTENEGRVKLDSGGFNPYYQARVLDGEIEEGEEVIVLDPGGGNVLTVTSREAVQQDSIDRELQREAERAGDGAEEGARGSDGGVGTDGAGSSDAASASSGGADGTDETATDATDDGSDATGGPSDEADGAASNPGDATEAEFESERTD